MTMPRPGETCHTTQYGAALTSSTLAHGIDLTETGVSSNDKQAWTNTLGNGTAGGIVSPGNCQNWTFSDLTQGNTGRSSVTDETWTKLSNHDCDGDGGARGLYCFQQR